MTAMRGERQHERREPRAGLATVLGRLFARPRFEVWAACAAGGPLYLEASGLTRRAACAAATRHLRERPGVPVVVLDDTGRKVYPAPPRAQPPLIGRALAATAAAAA
jgi:hypothetical protein